MKVIDEKLGKFISAMNNEEAHIYLIEELASIREHHRLEREEDRWVKVGNGEKEKKLLTEAFADTHDRVVVIEENTQVLREVSGFFAFMKKYKAWWLVGAMVAYILGSIGLDVTLVNIKSHLP